MSPAAPSPRGVAPTPLTPPPAAAAAVDPAAAGAPPPSERVRLARLTRRVALGVPGVVGTDAGPDGRWATPDGAERLEGVTCIAAPGGGYEVELRLVCGLVPLHALGAAVRGAVATAARSAQLPVERIDVTVVSVTSGGLS
jgi:hypothetical protein